jgi:hypothetical protein
MVSSRPARMSTDGTIWASAISRSRKKEGVPVTSGE